MRTLSDFRQFPDYNQHKQVIEISRPEVGLRGFIAIHNTTLGPAVGGTRMYPYRTEREAITDVLRLSHAMTYKCALAGVNFGGGKGVIIGDPKKIKTPELLRAYAEEINKLKGNFYTGEDVGMLEQDITEMLRFSKYIIGKRDQAGDPSPFAAKSTFVALKATLHAVFGNSILNGRKFALKGVGKVGTSLASQLLKEGGDVVVSDIDKDAVASLLKKHPNIYIGNNESILEEICDAYMPCALGNEFTFENIKKINTKIICGAANNQLVNPEVGREIFNRGIIFIPDYVANAGGLINVVDELNPAGYDPKRVNTAINNIDQLVTKILERSKSENTPMNIVADAMAEEVLSSSKPIKS